MEFCDRLTRMCGSCFAMQLLKSLDSFVVVEREGQIIACAALFPFFEERCGEIAAIAVSAECRGQGQGDKLLGMIMNCCFITYSMEGANSVQLI